MLVASLHQGISDLMPTRLEFYENWLNPVGMRDGKIGLAPLAAVLSFLRQEGEPYTLVTQRAGRVCRTMDVRQPHADRAIIHSRAAGDDARPAGDAARQESGAPQLPGQPGGREAAPRPGNVRASKLDFLHRARAVRRGPCACFTPRRCRICSRSSVSAAKCASMRVRASAIARA